MKKIANITTSGLLSELLKTGSIQRFLTKYDRLLEPIPLFRYLENLCQKKNVAPSHVIRMANIERTYGLQIFRGIKNPSRDKMIQLAFGFSLNTGETQKLLKAAGKSTLYPKIRRDAVFIYCLQNGKSILDVQELLYDLKLPLLGDKAYE